MLSFYLSLVDETNEQDKLVQIYDKYKNLMLSVAHEILNDTYLAEDAVHNAFIKLSHNLHKIENVDDYKTKGYVATIARNCAKDVYVKQHKIKEIEYSDAFSFGKPLNKELPVTVEDKLSEKIKLLPQMYFEVLVFKYYYNHSGKEIASILGISEGVVYKRIERAKEKLEVLLNEQNQND